MNSLSTTISIKVFDLEGSLLVGAKDNGATAVSVDYLKHYIQVHVMEQKEGVYTAFLNLAGLY